MSKRLLIEIAKELLTHTQSTPQNTFSVERQKENCLLTFQRETQCAVMQENWIRKTLRDVDFLSPQSTDNGFTNNSLIMIFTLYNDFL